MKPLKPVPRSYAWGGWKMPVLHPNDAEYCEFGCPICTRARNGVPWAVRVQRFEEVLTGGGCWWGRARQRKYGVKPHERMPAE